MAEWKPQQSADYPMVDCDKQETPGCTATRSAEEFANRNSLTKLARRVAARLSLEYSGVFFHYLDEEDSRHSTEQELAEAKSKAQLALYRAIENSVGGIIKKEEGETKSTKMPPFSVQELTTLARVAGLEDPTTRLHSPRQQQYQSEGSSSKAATTLDPRAKVPGFPTGSFVVPKDVFLENVKHAAALVAESRNEHHMNWEYIVNNVDQVLYDEFAELIAVCISETPQRLINRIHDGAKISEQRRIIRSILDKFATARRSPPHNKLSLVQSRAVDRQPYDPVTGVLELVGYYGYP